MRELAKLFRSMELNLPSGKTSQTDSETSTQLDETSVQRKLLLKVVGDKDGHDETVDTDDTSHDNGDNVWISSQRNDDTSDTMRGIPKLIS